MWYKTASLVEFMYFVVTRMPGESYCRWLRSLLCLCDVFQVLINPLCVDSAQALWASCHFRLWYETLGLILFQIVGWNSGSHSVSDCDTKLWVSFCFRLWYESLGLILFQLVVWNSVSHSVFDCGMKLWVLFFFRWWYETLGLIPFQIVVWNSGSRSVSDSGMKLWVSFCFRWWYETVKLTRSCLREVTNSPPTATASWKKCSLHRLKWFFSSQKTKRTEQQKRTISIHIILITTVQP